MPDDCFPIPVVLLGLYSVLNGQRLVPAPWKPEKKRKFPSYSFPGGEKKIPGPSSNSLSGQGSELP